MTDEALVVALADLACPECDGKSILISTHIAMALRIVEGVLTEGPKSQGFTGSGAVLVCDNPDCEHCWELLGADYSDDECAAIWDLFEPLGDGQW